MTVTAEAPRKVLIADDDPLVRHLLERTFTPAGYETIEASDAAGARTAALSGRPDLVLLDIELPDGSGLDVLGDIRRESDVAVIIVSGRGSEGDRILGLSCGADDYVVKPFSPRELVARAHAVLSRGREGDTAADARGDEGGIQIDARARQVHRDGVPVSLAPKEFDLLAYVASRARQAFSRSELLGAIWGSSPDCQDPSTVTEHVRRIRLKLENDPEHPVHLVTVRSYGYRYDP